MSVECYPLKQMTPSRLLLISSVVLITMSLSRAQNTLPALPKNPPELKLEIIPVKKAYLLGEPVVVKYKFTNLSDRTLCLPRPDIKSEDETDGYIRAWATNIDGESENFLEGFYPRGYTDQQLLNDANEKWIKLAPGLTYVSEEARPVGILAPGDWKLQSRYVPPDLRGRAKLIIDALGCTPPEVAATSKPVGVMVERGVQNP
jgi:hypothetical protein